MSLDKNSLQTNIRGAFAKAQATPPPADPKDSDTIQQQVLTQLAQDLADAIHTFVLGAAVVGVNVSVVNTVNQPIGTGTQTGIGHLQ